LYLKSGEKLKTLVTGATGFVGKHLVKRLVEEKRCVTCLVRETSDVKSLERLGVEFVYGDLLSKDSIKEIVEKKGISIIYHLAGKVYSNNEKEFYKVNYEGTKNIFDACLNSRVNKFIFLSSLATIGPALNNEELDEKTEPNPLTDYGRSKYLAENYILKRNKKNELSVIIVRSPLVYGVGMSRKSRFYGILRMAKYGFLIKVGRKNNQIPLCHLDNLIIFFQMLEERNDFTKGVYHIRDDIYYDLHSIKEILEKILSRRIRTIQIPYNLKKVFLICPFINRDLVKELGYDWGINIDKLKKEFNFVPKGMFEESLPAILKTYDLL